jgi:hypothetical protein
VVVVSEFRFRASNARLLREKVVPAASARNVHVTLGLQLVSARIDVECWNVGVLVLVLSVSVEDVESLSI